MSTFVPAEPFPPGEYLQDELDARGWTQDDLSDVTGISRRQIINIIQGKSGITPESAKAIGAAFDQDPMIWMNLQVSCELATAQVEERNVRKKAAIFSLLPVRELQRRGWLLDYGRNVDSLESAVCHFLRIRNLDEIPKLSAAARKAGPYAFTNPAQLAWYFRVRQIAEMAPVTGKYCASNWESGTRALLELAANAEDTRRVPQVLAEMGVRLVLVQHLKKSKVDGVALWIDANSPVVGLSLRYDRMDNFWFTLIHELIHIKHKHESPVDEDIGPKEGLPEIEQVANSEASAMLVDADKLESFVARCGPLFQQARVVQFARSIGVHPHIVLGQLRHRGELGYSQLTKLQEKVAEHIRGQALTDGWGDTIPVELEE